MTAVVVAGVVVAGVVVAGAVVCVVVVAGVVVPGAVLPGVVVLLDMVLGVVVPATVELFAVVAVPPPAGLVALFPKKQPVSVKIAHSAKVTILIFFIFICSTCPPFLKKYSIQLKIVSFILHLSTKPRLFS